MTSTFIIGILTAFVATTLAAALRRAPTRTRCPACGGATLAVQPEAWLLRRMPDLRMRWCGACSWQGWGRHGAEWNPGHPASHDSGFYWGEDSLPEGFGFRFADELPTVACAEPPHHPSGFRFSTPPEQRTKVHPSGFSWADGEAHGEAAASEPPGFQWAPPNPEGGPRFAWGGGPGRRTPSPRGLSRHGRG